MPQMSGYATRDQWGNNQAGRLLLMGLLGHLQACPPEHGLVGCVCCHVCPGMGSSVQLQLPALSCSLQNPSTLPCWWGLSLQYCANLYWQASQAGARHSPGWLPGMRCICEGHSLHFPGWGPLLDTLCFCPTGAPRSCTC